MTTLVTGATGFVGQRLVGKLKNCVVTSRSPQKAESLFGDSIERAIGWNYQSAPIRFAPTDNFNAVVNLMGESIAEGRWTAEKKKRILDSRVEGTRQLVEAILAAEHRPKVVVSASAVGIYGDQGDKVLDEQSDHGRGYLVDVCKAWEDATKPLVDAGIRTVLLRVGIVLGKEGGALQKLLPIFKLGIGGKLGNGMHFVPWIHVDDLVSMIAWAIETEGISGALNGTAPNPVRNTDFTKAIAKAVRRPAILPVPKFALRMVFGEFANSLFFSQNVMPEAALRNGFQFEYPIIKAAVEQIVNA